MAADPITGGMNVATAALELANKLTPTLSQSELQAIRNELQKNLEAIDYHLKRDPNGGLRDTENSPSRYFE